MFHITEEAGVALKQRLDELKQPDGKLRLLYRGFG